MPVVSPSQDGRLLPWRARKDWDWACLVPSRRNLPILVECLLFSFSPALSPLTSLFTFTTSPFSFPSPSHSLSSRFGTPFTHQWECKGRNFRPRNRTTPKTTTTRATYHQVGLPDPSIPQASTRLPTPTETDVHDGTIDCCRRVGKHRDRRGFGLPVHRLGSSTREQERRGRALL